MPVLLRLLFLSLPALACASAPAQEATPAPAAIKVVARKNPGDIPYRGFLRMQRRLLSKLPPEPRKLDIMLRISFTELPGPGQDEYLPQSWAVSVVGDSVDETVQVRRGGYFLLPELKQAEEEDATIMFKEQSRKGWLDIGWVVRTGEGQRLRYAELGQAMAELRTIQKEISMFDLGLRAEKYGKYDTLKACFLEPGGQLRINGKPAADAAIGNCALLRVDPSRAATGDEIEFAGQLDIVTLVEGRQYASILAPAPAG